MHTNDKEPEYRIHKIFYKLIKKINNFKIGSIHFTKEDNRIGKGAHPYRSWEKCKFKPQKAKIKRNEQSKRDCHFKYVDGVKVKECEIKYTSQTLI